MRGVLEEVIIKYDFAGFVLKLAEFTCSDDDKAGRYTIRKVLSNTRDRKFIFGLGTDVFQTFLTVQALQIRNILWHKFTIALAVNRDHAYAD